jgi:translation initiation factor 1
MPRDENRTVYSTDPNFSKRCPRCGSYPCRCPKPKSLPPEQQTAAIQREVKGRGGKTVTVIRNLQLTSQDLAALAKLLKQACGSGGTIKDGNIEIQGDHRESDRLQLERAGL